MPSHPRSVLTLFVLLLLGVLARADRPNIIIFYTDDQGFGDASCLNSDAKFKTPNIDRLSREGITFTNGHSSDSVCTPSRYGLLTGRYSWRTRLKTGVMGAEGECLIRPGQSTIASLLKDSGYRTSMVGKWHLGMDFPGDNPQNRDWSQPTVDMPLDKGFDHFFGIPASLNYGVLAWFDGRHAKVPPTLFTAKKPNKRHSDYRIMPPYQETSDATAKQVGKSVLEVAPDFKDDQCLTRFTDEAMNWMSGHLEGPDKEKPFFLYLPMTSPHYPVCPLPEFHGQGECGGYGEFVIETDHHLGRILDFLDRSKVADDTLIVYTSDNGPETSWVARIKQFGHHSNAIYREGKRSVYEGGHRVPFLVRWPKGVTQPGRRFDGPVGQIDLLATLAEIADVELDPDDGVDSQSFASVLADPDEQHHRLPLINHSIKGRFSITEGPWKLVLPHGKLGFELYHLQDDPGEKNDLAKDRPDLVEKMSARATAIVADGRTTSGPTQSNDTGYWKDLKWMTPADYSGHSAPSR